MKKCPFCAEEIQDEAIKCKHCGRSLIPVNINQNIQQQNTIVSKEAQSKENKRLLKYGGIGCLGLIAIALWYFTLPIAIAFGFYKIFKKINAKKRLVISIIIYLILAPFGIMFIYNSQRMPIISIAEPQDNYSIQADKVVVKGTVIPKSTDELKINGIKVEPKDGNFEKEVKLSEEKNTITISARNNSNTANATITIERIFTPEEKAERERITAEAKAESDRKKAEEEAKKAVAEEQQKKAEAEQQAKNLTEQKAWESTKAGQICKKHPDWSREDCKNLADKKIWIGMSYDMLVEMWGKPNHANPSNYGSGTQWQWCWTAYSSPSCFYDTNGDGLVDSYN